MRKALTTTLTLAAVAALGIGLGPVAATALDEAGEARGVDKLDVVGLASGGTELVSFRTNNPGKTASLGTITGLLGDTRLIGIDYRVQDGALYGVGNGPTGAGVYKITGTTAVLVGRLSTALQGTSFGVDFNPAANALRVVSDTGQNLRQSFIPTATGGFAATANDIALTTPPTMGTTTGITGAAYTNNDLDMTTATTLFDLNTATNTVVIQSPANNGLLVPTGTTAVDLVGDTGFDIHSTLRNGKAVAQAALAVNAGRLYAVDLLTGQLEDDGQIGDGTVTVTDIAIPLDQL